MKRLFHSLQILLLISASVAPVFAQEPALRPTPAAVMVATAEGAPAHSPGHKDVIEWVNFAILIAFLIYFLRKPVAQFFDQRSAAIRDSLEEGRKALVAAKAEMEAVEEKLLRLEQEVASLKASAMEEIKVESERMRRASEQEAARILESAGHSIESATLAAKLELKNFAARQSSEMAEKMIRDRMDPHSQARLVSRFLEALGGAHHTHPPA